MGIDVKLPKAKTAVEEKDMGQNLVVGVKGDGRVYVDKTEVTKETLVAEIIKVRASRALVLKGDKTATYRQVREVMDLIHKDVAGTDTMLLATEKIKEEGAE